MSKQTIIVNFHGIPLAVAGRYFEQKPETNSPAAFEIESVRAGILLAGDYLLGELHERDVKASVWDFIEEEALEQIEAGFEAAAQEAADARRQAREDASRE